MPNSIFEHLKREMERVYREGGFKFRAYGKNLEIEEVYNRHWRLFDSDTGADMFVRFTVNSGKLSFFLA